jgi:hypothetical protein
MKTAIISLSDIFSHPTSRMDAEYHVGKKNGKAAYKKGEDGMLIPDDTNGKVMATKETAKQYNDAKRLKILGYEIIWPHRQLHWYRRYGRQPYS